MKIPRLLGFLSLVCLSGIYADPPKAYFADGFHGGIYGHYPAGYTAYLVEQLRAHPDWKINLEIEPATWDYVRLAEPAAYADFMGLAKDQTTAGRVEIVNPSFAQSYFFTCSGESAIRQFHFGIGKLREHFPVAKFDTYSSEEPCFTSALPGILKSFGFRQAVLKNPNTAWGGYTSAHGGELVNWIGPDGASLPTVPRYAGETFVPGSVFQTTAATDSPAYVRDCLAQGIAHPVGMCLQDAGWRSGPWLGGMMKGFYQPTESVIWRNYFENIAVPKAGGDWRFTAEDVQPGLVWGAQILQRLAQRVRRSENNLLVAEKLRAAAAIEAGMPWPDAAFGEAWRRVLLSQHHDAWIVPYNGGPGNSWAEQAARWTATADALSADATDSGLVFRRPETGAGGKRGTEVRVFNPTAATRDEVIAVRLPDDWTEGGIAVNADGQALAAQVVDGKTLLVRIKALPLGYTGFEIKRAKPEAAKVAEARATTESDGRVVLETDLYRLVFDAAKGGTISSLVAKTLGNREFVDRKNERRFNELRGNFYDGGGFHSSADQPAAVRVIESGPLRVTAEISGTLAGSPFVQRVSLSAGSRRIDCSVRIDWRGNPGIGEFKDADGWRNPRRAFYDSRYALLAQFPMALENQRIWKNAPFDVCESRLADTFFNSWDRLKNNVILDWVDVTDGAAKIGLALFSDHTTSYAHGPGFPLGLTLQYSGRGLWGRDYRIDGPTEVRYALVPHAGRWDAAHLWSENAAWKQPLLAAIVQENGPPETARAFVDPGDSGWDVPAMYFEGDHLFVRLFNAEGDAREHAVKFGFEAKNVCLMELDGRIAQKLATSSGGLNVAVVKLAMPRFGVRTLRMDRPSAAP